MAEVYAVEEQPLFVFTVEGVKHFECALKHFCALHGLFWEHITTIISTQLAESQGKCDDIYRKMLLVSSITSELEELIDEFMHYFLLKEVATATEQIRVSKADLRQFVWQYGHFVLTEEHFADYISSFVKKLHHAKAEEEKKEIQEKILQTSNFLYLTRLERKKYLTAFVEKIQSADLPSQVQ